jgi:hypothetical protein
MLICAGQLKYLLLVGCGAGLLLDPLAVYYPSNV